MEVFLAAFFRDTANSLVVIPPDSFLAIDTSNTARFHDGQLQLEMFLKNGSNTP